MNRKQKLLEKREIKKKCLQLNWKVFVAVKSCEGLEIFPFSEKGLSYKKAASVAMCNNRLQFFQNTRKLTKIILRKKLNKSFLFEPRRTDEDLPAVNVGCGKAATAVAVAAVRQQVLALGPRGGDHRRTSCAQLPAPARTKWNNERLRFERYFGIFLHNLELIKFYF